ncbi:MAG: CoA-binding protein [Thermoanaerobaculia bacterium]
MAGINDPGEIARALKTARTIAVVGCSPEESRPSHAIASYLLSAGFDVIPVNPGHTEILGRTCYPDLASIPKDVRLDIVDVFRRSEFVPGIADAALACGARFFWMQDGVVDAEAARRLTAAGIPVAMDRCIYRDHAAL